MILSQQELRLANRELTSRSAAFLPNLVQEVFVAHAVENQLGRSRSIGRCASGRHSDGCRGFPKVVDANRDAVSENGLQAVFARGVSLIADHEVERNLC